MFNHFSDVQNEPLEERLKHILHAIRVHLGMDVGFISEFRDGNRFFRHVDAASPRSAVVVGGSDPLRESYCHYIVSGVFPELMQDAALIPLAAAMPVTKALPVGAHLSAPIRLDDGSVYGTFCCFSHTSDHSLNQRDLALLKLFADMTGKLIQAEVRAKQTRSDKSHRIERVLRERQLSIVYQPLYRLSDDSLAGFEALSRFSAHPLRSPDLWFAEAEEVGLAADLELIAAKEAAVLLKLVPKLLLAVNISPRSILSSRFQNMFAGFPVERMMLEVTEHAAVENYAEIRCALAPLQQRGLRLAIDDVGAGNSTLRHVLELKPDLIKLDMSLTRDIHCDPHRRALVDALTRFGLALGSEIVAEGVENALELNTLREIGVTKAQGFFLGRPMPLAEALGFPAFLMGGQRRAVSLR